MVKTTRTYSKPRRLTAPWSIEVVELLHKHGELTVDQLVAKAGPTIPPGRALRRRESEKKRARAYHEKHTTRKTGMPYVARPTSQERSIEIGRREIITWALRSLTKYGRIVRIDYPDGTVAYKLGEVELRNAEANE